MQGQALWTETICSAVESTCHYRTGGLHGHRSHPGHVAAPRAFAGSQVAQQSLQGYWVWLSACWWRHAPEQSTASEGLQMACLARAHTALCFQDIVTQQGACTASYAVERVLTYGPDPVHFMCEKCATAC